jgi:NAD(P)-dependent dehydrogenase (short-subunit alcohol dehydrogenase family)
LGSRDLQARERAAAALREQKIEADSIKFDILQEEDHFAVREYLDDTYGRLDILVNNAGFGTSPLPDSLLRVNEGSRRSRGNPLPRYGNSQVARTAGYFVAFQR